MSCSDRIECERLKVLKHACILAKQEANIRNTEIAVVKLTHHLYGDYFKGIDYDEARDKGYKVLRKFKPSDPMAV